MDLRCLHCAKSIKVVAADAGQTVSCPHCRRGVLVPRTLFASEHAETRRTWWEYLVSGVSTLVIHALLLVTLGLIYWGLSQGRGLEIGGEVSLGQLPDEHLTQVERPELDAAGDAREEPQLELEDDFADVAVPLAPLDDALAVNPIVPSGGSQGGGRAGFQPGAASAGGEGFGLKARFMNVEAAGRYFCIIADASSSMAWGRTPQDTARSRLDYVKDEILETLGTLPAGARAYVIFFNTGATAFPDRRWLRKDDHDEVAAWLKSIQPVYRTNPLDAFRLAMQLQPPPDVIFLMTDGEFDPEIDPRVPEQVAAMNRGEQRVTIHTIAFISNNGAADLKRIADESDKGKFRFVPGF